MEGKIGTQWEAEVVERFFRLRTTGPVRKDMGLREVWFRDLYRTRSPIAHGALSSKERRRSTQEHLLLASYVVPLLVLGELGNVGQYTLTESDAVHAFDGLLRMSDCFEQEQHTMSFRWPQVVLGEERRAGIGRVLVEYL